MSVPGLDVPAIAELAAWDRWVLWSREQRGDRATKVPIQPDGRPASTTRAATWSSYTEAAAAHARGIGDGIGFVFTSSPFAGVDFDGCIDAAGVLAPWAARIVERLDSYTEISPSGRGLHIIVRAELPGTGRKRGSLEIYDTGRYFTMTARPWPGAPDAIAERTEALAALYGELGGTDGASRKRSAGRHTARAWNGELPDTVRAAMDADATVRLTLGKRHSALGYSSPSEADYALACRLVELGHTDAETEAAVRWRHAHIEPRPKDLGYFPRTVANARAQAGTRRATR